MDYQHIATSLIPLAAMVGVFLVVPWVTPFFIRYVVWTYGVTRRVWPK